jgi:hypothetical protein
MLLQSNQCKANSLREVISPLLVLFFDTDKEPSKSCRNSGQAEGKPLSEASGKPTTNPLALAHKHSQELFNAISISRFHC